MMTGHGMAGGMFGWPMMAGGGLVLLLLVLGILALVKYLVR
jgi:hypothetical protein